MKQATKALIEDMLRDYNKINAFVSSEKQEWRNDAKAPKLLTMDDVGRLDSLINQLNVIDSCLDEAGDTTVTIITALYFNRSSHCTLDTLIAEGTLNLTKRMAYQLRDRFLWKVAGSLGIFDF